MSDASTPAPDAKATATARAIQQLEAEKSGLLRSIAQKQARLEIIAVQLEALQPAK